ncbi:MgtC/SapB family protein [Paraclostridium sordellii]|uniref:MgtC/SapB family protein n=1 Tax=Paraclostridium sordellii TaxID=1505 RepID=UPI0007DC0036|nr:MgtC/SapB family protein [Paeniclostridium sordellii]MDU7904373.1 MgtC/SapB family protein [Peptostreptococcaceae bacterium]AUN13038.1 cation transporter [Paeniclostridium sordellii]MDU2147363.1 MgtC/SapB family protein [Paeniclostridium sordellii]MDU4414051.1 MgtC/SapB family protein [Paeniclostridium sordellii]MDU6248127.1 MgtC/SapB family protein [Paeniclostridium sordellii]
MDISYKREEIIITAIDIITRLLIALIIGGLTGLEREKSYQFAGFRTHILVAVGSCITSITSVILFIDYGGKTSLDPSRLTAQVLSGIGFLGTGAILKNSSGIRGLTTAAGIWATACIGIAIGYGQYTLGILAWVFVLITLYILKNIDKLLFRKKQNILTIEVDDINIISTLYNKLEKSQIKINNIDINNGDKGYIVNFFIVYDRRIMVEKIILELNDLKNIISIDYLH